MLESATDCPINGVDCRDDERQEKKPHHIDATAKAAAATRTTTTNRKCFVNDSGTGTATEILPELCVAHKTKHDIALRRPCSRSNTIYVFRTHPVVTPTDVPLSARTSDTRHLNLIVCFFDIIFDWIQICASVTDADDSQTGIHPSRQ